MAEDLGPLILCWSSCAQELELVSYEEDGEVTSELSLRWHLLLSSSDKLSNLSLTRCEVHVWVQVRNQDTGRLPMHIRTTFLPFILLKKLDFAWSTLKLPFNCLIPSFLDEETTHVFLKPATYQHSIVNHQILYSTRISLFGLLSPRMLRKYTSVTTFVSCNIGYMQYRMFDWNQNNWLPNQCRLPT